MPATNLRRFAREAKTLPRQWVEQAVKDTAKAVNRSVSSDAGGDAVLSGVRAGRTKLRASTRVEGTAVVRGEVAAGPAKARAQWFWLEEGARRRRVGRTKAFHTWEGAVRTPKQAALRDAAKMFVQAIGG